MNEEKRKLKEHKKKVKKIKNIRNKIKTALDWSDIKSVSSDNIILKDGTFVFGVKLTPFDIFTKPENEANMRLASLIAGLNTLTIPVYNDYILSPLHIEEYKMFLNQARREVDDPVRKEMLYEDLEKAQGFEKTFSEIEFYALTTAKTEREREKNLDELFRCFKTAGLEPAQLDNTDYLNYIAYIFENPTINSYYFPKHNNIFSTLYERYDIDDDGNLDYEQNYISENTTGHSFIEVDDLDYKGYAPTVFAEYDNYMRIGNKYCSIYSVNRLPSEYATGLFKDYINDKNIKIFINHSLAKTTLPELIQKKIRSLENKIGEETNYSYRDSLNNQIASLKEHVKKINVNKYKTLDVSIFILLSYETKEQLTQAEAQLQIQFPEFDLINCVGFQQDAFKLALPIFQTSKLPEEIRNNFGMYISTENAAGFYPYNYTYLKDKYAFILGYENTNHGIWMLDRYFFSRYTDDINMTADRTAGNIIILGSPGYGKSVTLNQFLRNDIRDGRDIITIDPENVQARTFKKYGGKIIFYGVEGNILNIFDLRPIDTGMNPEDPDYDEELDLKLTWSTKNAIKDCISQANIVFSYLFTDYSDSERAVFGAVINETYKAMGFNIDSDESFRYKSKDQMPTFSDVAKVLFNLSQAEDDKDTLKIMKKLSLRLAQVTDEYHNYLDGHTSIDFNDDRKMVLFATKKIIELPERLQIALNHILYTYAWSLCIGNKKESAFYIDEAHVNLKIGKTAYLTNLFARRGRKYNNVLCLATHNVMDFDNPEIKTEGDGIFNSSTYILALHLNLDQAQALQRKIGLTDLEVGYIVNLEKGQCLMQYGKKKAIVNIYATQKELTSFSTKV